MTRLDQQMAERRERILDAARRIIGDRGYERLTMRDLAKRSRVTVPTIYNLIGSKEQVLFAAVAAQTGDFVSALRRHPGDVVSVVDAAVRELLRMPRYYRALLRVMLTSEVADPARRVADRALSHELDAAMDEIALRGELVDWIDPTLIRERIHAHLDMTSIEWARGARGAESFRAAARFEAATTLLAVTTGASREHFARVAAESQSGARLHDRERGARARG